MVDRAAVTAVTAGIPVITTITAILTAEGAISAPGNTCTAQIILACLAMIPTWIGTVRARENTLTAETMKAKRKCLIRL